LRLSFACRGTVVLAESEPNSDSDSDRITIADRIAVPITGTDERRVYEFRPRLSHRCARAVEALGVCFDARPDEAPCGRRFRARA
jgi:hypothetical protein